MPLSEHVYCVAVAFKMTDWVEHKLCIKFCIKLEHSSMETIGMIQKSAAVVNWWLAASSQQSTPSCIMFRTEVYGKISSHPSDSAPLQPRFGALQLLAFPKTKITFSIETSIEDKIQGTLYIGHFYMYIHIFIHLSVDGHGLFSFLGYCK